MTLGKRNIEKLGKRWSNAECNTFTVADVENEKGWFQVTLVRGKVFVGHAHLRAREDSYQSHGVCGRKIKTQETSKWIAQGTQTRSRQENS